MTARTAGKGDWPEAPSAFVLSFSFGKCPKKRKSSPRRLNFRSPHAPTKRSRLRSAHSASYGRTRGILRVPAIFLLRQAMLRQNVFSGHASSCLYPSPPFCRASSLQLMQTGQGVALFLKQHSKVRMDCLHQHTVRRMFRSGSFGKNDHGRRIFTRDTLAQISNFCVAAGRASHRAHAPSTVVVYVLEIFLKMYEKSFTFSKMPDLSINIRVKIRKNTHRYSSSLSIAFSCKRGIQFFCIR